MQKVYSTPDLMLGGLVRQALVARGIEPQVRNEFLNGALGDLPPQDCWYELWVADEDVRAARRAIAHFEAPPGADGPPWRCPDCGEELPPQFGLCWHCGRPREGA